MDQRDVATAGESDGDGLGCVNDARSDGKGQVRIGRPVLIPTRRRKRSDADVFMVAANG